MRRLPHRPTIDVSAEQRDMLTAWLAEWAIDRLLEPDAAKAPCITAKAEPQRDRPAPALEVGQIRVFQPFCPATRSRPLYGAVAGNSGTCSLVMPFSPFATPALPGELRTTLDAHPVRVLCAWNAAILPGATAAKSWVAGSLPPADVDDALALLEAIRPGHPTPDPLRPRVGPRCFHPEDPRRIYRNRERLLMDAVRGWGCNGAQQEGAVIRLSQDLACLDDARMPAAAEDRETYVQGAIIALVASTLRLRIAPAQEGRCRIVVEPAPKKANRQLDGFTLIARSATATIVAGETALPASELCDGFSLCDPEGYPVPLVQPG